MDTLEFYTIVTSVDLTANPSAVDYLLCTVSIRAHPVFIGAARPDKNGFLLRFAIDRPDAWDCSPSLKETILLNSSEFGFTEDNIDVFKADHV